jgi:hypothetical protein
MTTKMACLGIAIRTAGAGLSISNVHLNIYIPADERKEQQLTSKAIGLGLPVNLEAHL